MSSRFVAGMSIDEVLAVCARLNGEGITVSLDSLGEGVRDEVQAEASAAVYHRLLDEIGTRGLRAHVSVKLTQVGMDIHEAMAERILGAMVEHATAVRSFVRIDMEGSAYTEATIAMTERLHTFPGLRGRVGTVLQSYLQRTEADTERLLGQGAAKSPQPEGRRRELCQLPFLDQRTEHGVALTCG